MINLRKTFYIFTIIFFVISCKQKTKEYKLKKKAQNENSGVQNITVCKKQFKNGIEFETCISDYNSFTLKNLKGEILYKNNNNPSEFKFIDFNEDGFLDIVLYFITNTPSVNEILIFHPESKCFIEIVNFSNFLSSKKIKKTNYYYSYKRNGCADSNWISDLFYFEKNKAVKIGNIFTVECNNENENGIFFYKVTGENKKQIEFISIDKKPFESKWKFIEKYWTENYEKFK